MKAEWTLATKFMRRHTRQQIASLLTITLFATAILLMLFITQCFKDTNRQAAYDYYGDFYGQAMFADTAKVDAARQTLQNAGAGVVTVQARVLTGDDSNNVYIGYMDANARKMRAVRVKEGAFPQNSGEIALDQTAYYRLRLTAKIGDSVLLRVNQNGKISMVKFTLTGILYDYADHWSQIAENMLDYKDPELPSVLLGQKPESSIAVHVMYRMNKSIDYTQYGGKYIVNVENYRAKEYAASLDSFTASLTTAIGIFFLILALFGITVLARVTLQDRERFVKTLEYVGLTRGQRRGIFLIQGTILAFMAWATSVPLALGALAATVQIARLLGTPLVWSITPLPAAVTFALIIGFTLLIFLIQQHKFFLPRKRGLNNKPVPSRTFTQAWARLCRKSRFGKSTAVTILNAGCAFALVFGVFSAELSGATRSYGVVKAQGSIDYNVYIAQGMTSMQAFGASFPRDAGMSKQELEKLRSNRDVSVKYAYIDHINMPAFIRVSADETNDTLNSLKKKYPYGSAAAGFGNNAEVSVEISKARALFGYKKDETLVTCPIIVASDTETMKTLLKESGINASQDWEAFEQGKTVFALGGIFKKGDSLTVTQPVVPKGSTSSQMAGKVTTADYNVTVADAFTRAVLNTSVKPPFPYGDIQNPCVVISADAAMRADTQLRFSSVIANNANPGDAASRARAADAVHRASAVSKGMAIQDKAENIANWNKIVRQQTWPVYALVLAFMAILTAAVAFLTKIKLNTNLHSYALLRSVGMEESRLRYYLTRDSLQSTGTGVIIGLALSAALIGALVNHYRDVPMTPTLLHVILPIAVSGSILLLVFTALATVLTLKSLFKKSITESLQTEMF